MSIPINIASSLNYNNSILTKVAKITEPLNKNFGISTFTYIRLFENKMFRISNNTKWSNYYIKNQLYELDYQDSCQEYISKMGNNNSLLAICNPKAKVVDCMRNHDVYHGMSIYKKFNNYIEVYNFATSSERSEIINFYLNNSTLFERFITYFKNKANCLRDYNDNNKLICRKNNLLLPNNLNYEANKYNFIVMTTLDKINISNVTVKITRREAECLYLLSQGKCIKEIAKVLNISPRTAECYITHLKEKLNCRFKDELIKNFQDELQEYYKAEMDQIFYQIKTFNHS